MGPEPGRRTSALSSPNMRSARRPASSRVIGVVTSSMARCPMVTSPVPSTVPSDGSHPTSVTSSPAGIVSPSKVVGSEARTFNRSHGRDIGDFPFSDLNLRTGHFLGREVTLELFPLSPMAKVGPVRGPGVSYVDLQTGPRSEDRGSALPHRSRDRPRSPIRNSDLNDRTTECIDWVSQRRWRRHIQWWRSGPNYPRHRGRGCAGT